MPGWLLVLALAGGPIEVQEQPYSREIAEFKRLDELDPPKKGQIVFIGSSSFTRWTWVGRAFPGRLILNRAFGGSQLGDVDRRLGDVVLPYEPKQIVVYCGENDFAADPDLAPSAVVDRFKRLYLNVRKRLWTSSFVYVSMKPSPSRWALAPKFRIANEAIRTFLKKEKHTVFVDVWPVMLGKDGLPKAELYAEDQLHVNDEGYKLWIPLLDRVLLGKHNPRVVN